MVILFQRHAIAEPLDECGAAHDSERPLTNEGLAKLSQIALGMKRLELKPDLILCSPYLRARQTAEGVRKGLELKSETHFTDALIPEAPPSLAIPALAQHKNRVQTLLVVGHEPNLHKLVGAIIGRNENAFIEFKKGGVAKVAMLGWNPIPQGELEWLLTPRQLILIGAGKE